MPGESVGNGVEEAWKDGDESKTSPAESDAALRQVNSLDQELLARIRDLEAENEELRKKNKEQEITINTLRKQNEIYASSNKRLLTLSGGLK